jgi:hypothetical protein
MKRAMDELTKKHLLLLNSLQGIVSHARSLPGLSEFRPEVQKQKVIAHIKPTRIAVLKAAGDMVKAAQSKLGNAYGQIVHFTDPPKMEGNEALMHELRMNRALNRVLSIPEGKDRLAFIREALAMNRDDYLLAYVNDPGVISEDVITKLKLEYAEKRKPELIEAYTKAVNNYETVRTEAGRLNGMATEIVNRQGLDDLELVTFEERIENFPPRDEYEFIRLQDIYKRKGLFEVSEIAIDPIERLLNLRREPAEESETEPESKPEPVQMKPLDPMDRLRDYRRSQFIDVGETDTKPETENDQFTFETGKGEDNSTEAAQG